MLKCKTCGKYIYNQHGNSKYCERHRRKVDYKHADLTVNVSLKVLQDLIKDSEELERIKNAK